MESPDINPQKQPAVPEIESLLAIGNESVEYKGKYQISSWDFEYAGEHYERDVIMAFHKDGDINYSIEKAIDKIREKLEKAGVSFDWSKPINLQEVIDLYRKSTKDEERFYTVFETSGVFSIERLGYEDLRDQILEKIPPSRHYDAERIIDRAIKNKLDAWGDRRRTIDI